MSKVWGPVGQSEKHGREHYDIFGTSQILPRNGGRYHYAPQNGSHKMRAGTELPKQLKYIYFTPLFCMSHNGALPFIPICPKIFVALPQISESCHNFSSCLAPWRDFIETCPIFRLGYITYWLISGVYQGWHHCSSYMAPIGLYLYSHVAVDRYLIAFD